MRIRKIITITIPLLISLILWLISKQFLDGMQESFLKLLAQISGVFGATLLSIEFLLASRLKILDRFFGGLDKVYKLHHLVGGIAFLLALNHPIFLFINKFSTPNIAITYIFPIGDISYTLGVLALYSLIALLVLTFYIKLPYHLWKITHTFMIIPLILATLHILLINSDTSNFFMLKLWLITLLIIAGISYIYRRFLYNYLSPSYEYKIVNIIEKNSIVEIYLEPTNNQIDFFPAQFIYISFICDEIASEKHPFTISSSPFDKTIRISAKKSGDYTNLLSNLKINTKAKIYGPYGTFGEDSIMKNKSQIWIAGGIGITPFLSLLRYYYNKNPTISANLFYSVKTPEDAIYLNEIENVLQKMPNIKLHLYISDISGRITANYVKIKCCDIENSLIMLCGPEMMMNDLEQQFFDFGAKSRNIVYESFAFN